MTRRCPSCGAESSVLDLRCGSCGAYIRDRVPALNLFSTLWGIIESPETTFLRIARSEQKNYTFLLFALTGPVLVALVLAAARVGDTDTPFSYVLLACVAAGPVFGLLAFVAATAALRSVFRVSTGARLRFRQTGAYAAFGISPLLWTSVIVLPLQLGIFGVLLFSTNPPAWQTQPLPYWSFVGIDLLALLWSMVLLPRPFMLHGLSYGTAFTRTLVFWTVLAAFVLAGVFLFHAAI
ncbi:MAG: hypothetical protein C0600_15415 [Ignavibacteria bacterium]|nr:MAG: hypothetical protein C0600_15415 [Ignavibacteria bacterium]